MPIENIVYRQRAAGKPLTQLADYREQQVIDPAPPAAPELQKAG